MAVCLSMCLRVGVTKSRVKLLGTQPRVDAIAIARITSHGPLAKRQSVNAYQEYHQILENATAERFLWRL